MDTEMEKWKAGQPFDSARLWEEMENEATDKLLAGVKSHSQSQSVQNAFCATGPGGGQDNSCSTSGGGKDLGTQHREAYEAAYGDAAKKLKYKERNAKLVEFKKIHAEWLAAGSPQPGKESTATTPPQSPVPSSTSQPGRSVGESTTPIDAHSLAKSLERLGKDRHNFVHLADLRYEHPHWSRERFDTALHHARREGKITLSAVEGRQGLTDRDREHSIKETEASGKVALLGYASLRS